MGISLPTVDQLFGEPQITSGIINIPTADLHPFGSHPFEVLDPEDPKMQEMVESVREHGVLTPGIVRPRNAGGYEIISGHCRKLASTLAGREEMPCVVRNYNDDEAVIVMVDCNLQRENISIWEKAWAYRMKYDAMRHQGKAGGNTAEEIGKELGESGRQVFRYIRISYLVPAYKPYINAKKLSLTAGGSISYLPAAMQECLLPYLKTGRVLTPDIADMLCRLEKEGKLDEEKMQELFAGVPAERTRRNIAITTGKLERYFPPHMERSQITKIIDDLLEQWTRNNYPELLKKRSSQG